MENLNLLEWMSSSQQTPLHLASANNHMEAVIALLKAGSNPFFPDKYGHMAKDVAESVHLRQLFTLHEHGIGPTYPGWTDEMAEFVYLQVNTETADLPANYDEIGVLGKAFNPDPTQMTVCDHVCLVVFCLFGVVAT